MDILEDLNLVMITNSCGYQQRFPRLPLSSSTWCVRGGLRINVSLCAIWVLLASLTSVTVYPLVNVYITMERSTIFMGKSTISMATFNSYVKLPEGGCLDSHVISVNRALKLIHGFRLAFSQRSSVPRAISWDGNTYIYIHIYIVSIVYDQAISYHA